MPTKRIRRIQSNGSAGSKIVSVNEQQGFGNLAKQQGSTRIIYDAVQLQTTPQTTTLTLFQDCRTRKFPFTNLVENKLQFKEATTMLRFSCYIIECAAGTTNALGIAPLDYFPEFGRLYASTFNFYIANNRVIKDFPLASLYAAFNPASRFMGFTQIQPAAGALSTFRVAHDVYKFENVLVIPPQIEFRCDFMVPAIDLPAGFDWYFAMKLEGLGSLYAPKDNF